MRFKKTIVLDSKSGSGTWARALKSVKQQIVLDDDKYPTTSEIWVHVSNSTEQQIVLNDNK